MIHFNRNNFQIMKVISLIFIFITIILLINLFNKNNKDKIHIPNKMVEGNFNRLKDILGKPTYLEIDGENKMKTATWMSPLDNFNDFGKFGGCDYIKVHGTPSKKYHPYPANVFIIIGKYINVPEILFGPLKYASETINIEQLFIPKRFSDIYYNTGYKEVALVTGSCASVTISAITLQFVIDMINNLNLYKNTPILKLNKLFRNEYDKRVSNYLCGKGIINKINWFDPTYFKEKEIFYYGDKYCKKEHFTNNLTHIEGCDTKITDSGLSKDDFCKTNPEDECC